MHKSENLKNIVDQYHSREFQMAKKKKKGK